MDSEGSMWEERAKCEGSVHKVLRVCRFLRVSEGKQRGTKLIQLLYMWIFGFVPVYNHVQ